MSIEVSIDISLNKATDPEQRTQTRSQSGAEELAPASAKLYQYSTDSGEVPQEWRDVDVVPIFINMDMHQPSNYRPVPLTSVVCKTLDDIADSNIMSYFNGIYSVTIKMVSENADLENHS